MVSKEVRKMEKSFWITEDVPEKGRKKNRKRICLDGSFKREGEVSKTPKWKRNGPATDAPGQGRKKINPIRRKQM